MRALRSMGHTGVLTFLVYACLLALELFIWTRGAEGLTYRLKWGVLRGRANLTLGFSLRGFAVFRRRGLILKPCISLHPKPPKFRGLGVHDLEFRIQGLRIERARV